MELMLSNQIISLIATLKDGWSSAPILVSEAQVCEIFDSIYQTNTLDLDELAERWINDFLYYDCSDKNAGNHKAEQVREHALKLYQKPSGEMLIALFRNIEILTDTSANALLHLFEDVPPQVFIVVTSKSPQKIISTLQSRMLMLDIRAFSRWDNPHREPIEEFVRGKPEKLFQMTLAPSKESKFSRDDALWVIQGLQDAIEYGTLSPRFAKRVLQTRLHLETTNTIPKYLIDQLLISLSCE